MVEKIFRIFLLSVVKKYDNVMTTRKDGGFKLQTAIKKKMVQQAFLACACDPTPKHGFKTDQYNKIAV